MLSSERTNVKDINTIVIHFFIKCTDDLLGNYKFLNAQAQIARILQYNNTL